MEPMASGKPVIGAEIGGIPEMAIAGKTGWLFESGNADSLAKVLKEASEITGEEYEALSRNACSFAEERFNAESYITKLTEIYSSLMEEKK